jgi:hypothetical protein
LFEKDLDSQKKYNGAICCDDFARDPSCDNLFSADDIPEKDTYLPGSVFFQFACFGYGTPSLSDYNYWIGKPELNSEESFISPFPKKLLSIKNGPVAYIGHDDVAWLHGFYDPKNRVLANRWDSRIFPFKTAIENLLKGQPVGYAMSAMHEEYNIGNQVLSQAMLYLAKKRPISVPFKSELAHTFIKRSDAQNYFIFGDPAVRLRIPAA